jgi:hypothetical protein
MKRSDEITKTVTRRSNSCEEKKEENDKASQCEETGRTLVSEQS